MQNFEDWFLAILIRGLSLVLWRCAGARQKNQNAFGASAARARAERQRQKIYMVTFEYCHHGDLKSFLLENRRYFSASLRKLSNDVPKRSLNLNLVSWSYQVANGMEFLASKQVLHGDLVACNILLRVDNVVKGEDLRL